MNNRHNRRRERLENLLETAARPDSFDAWECSVCKELKKGVTAFYRPTKFCRYSHSICEVCIVNLITVNWKPESYHNPDIPGAPGRPEEGFRYNNVFCCPLCRMCFVAGLAIPEPVPRKFQLEAERRSLTETKISRNERYEEKLLRESKDTWKQGTTLSCRECKQVFKTKYQKYKHLRNSHYNMYEKFICHTCNKHFSSKVYLAKHLKKGCVTQRRNLKQKVFYCRNCCKGLDRKHHRDKHERICVKSKSTYLVLQRYDDHE